MSEMSEVDNSGAIRRRSAFSPAPLSFAQERLFFMDQLAPGKAIYHIPLVLRLRGELNIKAMERAMLEVIRRHEVCRTTFRMMEGGPRQTIAPSLAISLPVIEMTPGVNGEALDSQIRSFIELEEAKPFDLAQGPLLRATLLRLGPMDHALVVMMHHIISDGWSVGLLTSELSQLYESISSGRPSPLKELPVQYADYALWQRGWLQGPVMAEQTAYWKEKLKGDLPIMALPTDYARPAVPTFQGDTHGFVLSLEMGAALNRFCSTEKVFPMMVMLAGFYILLHRYTQQTDLLVGAPMANRQQPELEELIGFFVNTVVLRLQLSGDLTVRELVRRVKAVVLEANEHQDLPFEQLVHLLQPARTPNTHPLFQVMMNLQDGAAEPAGFGPLLVEEIEVPDRAAKFDLILSMTRGRKGWRGAWVYSTDLFRSETIQRMAGHYERILQDMMAHPDRKLGQINLLTRSESWQLRLDWNQTQVSYPREKSIPDLFEEQVGRDPTRVALSYEGSALTYGELNRRADHLALSLREQGVGRGTHVGICAERSVELVVGLLGILKAGGVYVPLDPSYPDERLGFMVEDTQVRVILTQSSLAGRLESLDRGSQGGHPPLRLLKLEEAISRKAEAVSHKRPFPVTAQDPAYIIYTSGSTGRPKGVVVPHQGVVRLVKNNPFFHLSEDDVFLQYAPVSFDASTFEIWASLLNGRRLVIMPAGQASLGALGKTIRQEGVTILWLTAGLFHAMVEEHLCDLAGVRQLLAGGDVLGMPQVRKAMESLPSCQLINGYGPTENTTFTCCHSITRTDLEGRSIPIGRPIGNTRTYIVDLQGQLVAVGVPGELWTGGDGLALGYWQRPDLTAEKFIPDPFSGDAGARLYRTGDICRHGPDGRIEFLGRKDAQVKIRGFRVELEEVERVLSAHPQVRQCTVVVREDRPSNKRLVAYVVMKPRNTNGHGPGFHPAADDQPDLKSFLQNQLPAFMVPDLVMLLDSMPLTPNGKVDRKALPVPTAQSGLPARPYLAPRDTLEIQVAKLWQEVLGVPTVSLHDNFFDLGGHSLLAVRLFAKLEKMTGRQFPLVTLFQAPTVERLAQVLRDEQWTPPWSPLVPIKGSGHRPPFYCVHGAGGNIVEYLHLSRYMADDQPFYGIQAQGLDGKAPWLERVEDMAELYIREVRAFQPEGPYYLGGASFGGLVAYEMAQQLRTQGQTVAFLALFDTNGPGYPQYQPGVGRWWRWYYLQRERFELHWSTWRMLEPGEARREFVQDKWARMRRYCWKKGKRVRQAWQGLRAHWSLPTALKEVNRSGRRANDYYEPKPYGGSVTLFRASVQGYGIVPEPTLGWGKLVAQGLEIIEVPGYHGSIIREPRVRLLAEKLNQCLQRTQTVSVGEAQSSVRAKEEAVAVGP